MDAIRVEGLCKRYGDRVGVAGLDLAVAEGTVFGFLGPNGAGKSTTIRLLMGFLRPDAGTARVLGKDCARQSHEIKRDVGYVPGDLRLHAWMTGRDALQIGGRARGRDVRAHGAELAELFELDLGVRVRSMSRGMRQKLGLILALAHRPRLLILDEPTSTLDPINQERLHRRLRSLAAEGVTVFFSSHVLSEVDGLCERVAILRNGRLVANEPLASLRRSAHREVTIRWTPGRVVEADPPRGLVVRERRGNEWRAELTGPAAGLVEWLRDKPLEDLVITDPELDSLFLGYYMDHES